MKVELISITPNAESLIEEAGRCCYKNEKHDPNLIQKWIMMGHESMLEHASATFRITDVSRTLTHQLVRHRIASYSQQSQRYVDGSSFQVVVPPAIQADENARHVFLRTIEEIQSAYVALRAMGIKKEDARFLLPGAATTEIIFTMNFRELRHFIKLRTEVHAQWEIVELASAVLFILGQRTPRCFGDLLWILKQQEEKKDGQ